MSTDIDHIFPDHSQYNFDPLENGITEPYRLIVHCKKRDDFLLKKICETGEKINLDLRDIAPGNSILKGKIQLLQEGRWVDRISYFPLTPEKIFNGKIKYLLFPQSGAKRICFVFQAINKKQAYNYIGRLAGVNAHRVYIKDEYGSDIATRSSYYLGNNRTCDIADQVQLLMEHITERLELDRSSVITAGSSKGGYAAIYHGLRFGAGDIVCGGPQVMLGSYLRSNNLKSIRPHILEYLAGSNTDEGAAWANSVLMKIVAESNGQARLHIHVGRGEPHYLEHVQPLTDMLDRRSISYDLDLCDYSTHEELAKYFPPYLQSTIEKLVSTESHTPSPKPDQSQECRAI